MSIDAQQRPAYRSMSRNPRQRMPVLVASVLHHNHACKFRLWGWTSATEAPIDLGEQSLQIMDYLTMDLSKFIRIELIRVTEGIVHYSTDDGTEAAA